MRVLIGVLLVVAALAVSVRLRAALIAGARVTSWFRTPAKNRSLPRAKRYSLHQLGWAVDLVPASSTIERQARALFPVVVNEGDHIHAQAI